MARIQVGDTADIESSAQQLGQLAADIKTAIDAAKNRVRTMDWGGEAADSMLRFHSDLDAQANQIHNTFVEFGQAVGLSGRELGDAALVIAGRFGGGGQ